MFTFTSLGMAIGFFPILDIIKLSTFSYWLPVALPNLAQDFPAQAFLARLASGHNPAGGGQDVDAHTAEYARNLAAPHVHPAPRLRHARQVGDGGFITVAVLQINPQNLVALLLHRLEVGDVALFLENAGDLQLQLGGGHVHFLVPRADGVANPRE